MAGKSSKLFCHKCNQSGGTLTRRQAGNQKKQGLTLSMVKSGTLTRRQQAGNGDKHKNEYFYMMHYDPTKKSKKRVCYIGYSGLTYILIDDERYHTMYWPWLEGMILADKSGNLDEDKRQEVWDVLWNLLIEMGWPKKFVFHKLSADLASIVIRERYFEVKNELKNSAFPEKRRLKMVDYSKCDDILDKRLSDLFRSDSFRQPIHIRLKSET